MRGIASVAMLCLLAGCYGRRADVRPAQYVGEYVCRCGEKAESRDVDRLTLRGDGSYRLDHMPDGALETRDEGKWTFAERPSPRVLLGNRAYGAQVDGERVRLEMNPALGHWFVKQ